MQPIHSIESNYGLIINISVTIINPGLRRARKGRRREEEEGKELGREDRGLINDYYQLKVIIN